jgi:soluble lytic murein transglycosylase-like protein
MVARPSLLIALLAAGPALASPVDWNSAGGGLFASRQSATGAQQQPAARTGGPTAPNVSNSQAAAAGTRQPSPATLATTAPAPGTTALAAPAPATIPPPAPPRTIPDPTAGYGEIRLLPPDQPLDAIVTRIANETGIDPKLLHALIIVESAYDPNAVSPVGAAGLTQLMPGTARELGVTNRFDVEANLRGGARYLALQIARFGDLRLALAAYNSGPGRVARLGRVPDIAETQAYVRDAIEGYLALTAGRGIRHRRQCRQA